MESGRPIRLFEAAAAAIVAGLLSGGILGCNRPLPEQDTYAGQLYLKRCGGQCHAAYNPRAMTPAMWQVQVDAMQAKMRAAGMRPLTADQREAILDYLTRNAGTQ